MNESSEATEPFRCSWAVLQGLFKRHSIDRFAVDGNQLRSGIVVSSGKRAFKFYSLNPETQKEFERTLWFLQPCAFDEAALRESTQVCGNFLWWMGERGLLKVGRC
jgi:hypothetical protein